MRQQCLGSEADRSVLQVFQARGQNFIVRVERSMPTHRLDKLEEATPPSSNIRKLSVTANVAPTQAHCRGPPARTAFLLLSSTSIVRRSTGGVAPITRVLPSLHGTPRSFPIGYDISNSKHQWLTWWSTVVVLEIEN